MLQKPERGGGLHIWDISYNPMHKEEEIITRTSAPDAPSLLIDYQVGDLLMINAFKLHQIQPFEGEIDRICLTFHVARHPGGGWYTWF
jgi:hypothetical protein